MKVLYEAMLQNVDVYKKGIFYTLWLVFAMRNILTQTTDNSALSIDVYTESCPPILEMRGFHEETLRDMLRTNLTILKEESQSFEFGCKNIFSATKTVCNVASKSSQSSVQLFHTRCATGKYFKSLFKSLGIKYKHYQFESNCIEETAGQENSIRARISDVVRFLAEVIKRWGWSNIVVFTDTDIGLLQQECSLNYISAVIVRIKNEDDALHYLKKEAEELPGVAMHFVVLCNPLNTRRVLHAANVTKFIDPPVTWIIMSDISLSLFDGLTLPFDGFIALVTAVSYTPPTQQQAAALLAVNTTELVQAEVLTTACTQFILNKQTKPIKVDEKGELSPLELEIYQVYTVENGPLQHEMFGNWTSSTGILNAWRMFPNMLRKMPGVHFRIVSIHNPPYTILTQEDGKYKIEGYYAAVLDILAQEMQFNYTVIRAVDEQYGVKLENGAWNGMVGYLSRQEADIAVADISKTTSRMEVVDYSPAISYGSLRIVYRKPEEGVHYKVYIMPFGWTTWLLVTLTIFVPAILLCITNRVSPYSSLHAQPEDGYDGDEFNLANCLLIMYGGFVQQGFEVDPKEVSGKIIVITVYISFVVVFAVYTSIFTSFLTVGNQFLPFTTLEELVKNKDYKVGAVNNSVFVDYCKNTSNKVYHDAWKKMLKDQKNFVPDVMAGIEKAYTSNYGFITPELSTKRMLNNNCSFIFTNEKLMPETEHFAFQKGFKYLEVFAEYIDRMHESGVINRLTRRFEADELALCDDSGGAQSLGIKRVLSLFLLLAMAAIMSGLILLIERKLTSRSQTTLTHVKPLSLPHAAETHALTTFPRTDRTAALSELDKELADGTTITHHQYTYSNFSRTMYSNRNQTFMIPMAPTTVPRSHFFRTIHDDYSLK